MKKNKVLAFIALFAICLSPACNKNGGTSPSPQPANSYYMTATINGAAWKAASPSFTNISGVLIIAGGASVGHQVISLQAPYNSTIATPYAMNATTYGATYNTTAYSSYVDTLGTITFTAISATNVAGTFSFNAKNLSKDSVVTITNGKFNVPVL